MRHSYEAIWLNAVLVQLFLSYGTVSSNMKVFLGSPRRMTHIEQLSQNILQYKAVTDENQIIHTSNAQRSCNGPLGMEEPIARGFMY